MRSLVRYSLVLGSAITLASCGGGGGGTTTPPDIGVKPQMEAGSLPDITTKLPCDPLTANGASNEAGTAACASGDKCTVVEMTASSVPTLQCMPLMSPTVAIGATCTRAYIGNDNCVAQSVCTKLGVAAGGMACRQYCNLDSECPSSASHCVDFDQFSYVPNVGVCLPACTFLGTDCAGGMTCNASPDAAATNTTFTFTTYCQATGTTPLGQSCNTTLCGGGLQCEVRPCKSNSDCMVAGASCAQIAMTSTGPVMGCLGDFICQQQCDSTHACPTGQQCFPWYTGVPNNAGYCRP